MIPFAAFLAQALSTRWLFALSAGLFTVSSALCAMAWDMPSMIAFRVIQGFVGGAMIPTTFATGFAMFSGHQRAMIPAILGMVSVFAPTLGPTLGGWLTDAFTWRMIFFVNVIPGAMACLLAILFIRVDRPNLAMLKKIDYAHLASMAVFLGGLEYVLEEAPRAGWFDEPRIAIAGWLSIVALVLFLERSFRSGAPILRLSPFRKPTFAFACIFNVVIGFGLYSSTYLIPVFLGQVRGFNSLQIGQTVFVTGIAQILSTVITARASQRVDPRIVITFGLTLFAASLYMTSHLTPEWGFAAFLGPQVLRGIAMMMCIVPTVGMALGGFEQSELRYASGLFNLMRNLGGAVGIAVVNTWLTDAARTEAARVGEAMGRSPDGARSMVEGLSVQFAQTTPDAANALSMAQGELARLVGRYALTDGFNEVFRIMSIIFIAALVMVPFCRPPPLPGASPKRL